MQNKAIKNIHTLDNNVYYFQYIFYSYANSLILTETIRLYLYNNYTELYVTNEEQSFLNSLKSYDHRLLQGPQEAFAEIFRNKIFLQGIQLELFDQEIDDPVRYFKYKFIDSDFLLKINEKDWDLMILWCEYLKKQLRSNLAVTRHIARSLLFSDEPNRAFEESNLAVELIWRKCT